MVGSSIGLLVNGNGVFYTPMAQELNLLRGSVSLHGTFLSLSTAFASLTVNTFFKRFGWKRTILLCVICGIFVIFLYVISCCIIFITFSNIICLFILVYYV